jgi:hypothetical protein
VVFLEELGGILELKISGWKGVPVVREGWGGKVDVGAGVWD